MKITSTLVSPTLEIAVVSQPRKQKNIFAYTSYAPVYYIYDIHNDTINGFDAPLRITEVNDGGTRIIHINGKDLIFPHNRPEYKSSKYSQIKYGDTVLQRGELSPYFHTYIQNL